MREAELVQGAVDRVVRHRNTEFLMQPHDQKQARQRTTPWIAGIGPSSTIRARKALCSGLSNLPDGRSWKTQTAALAHFKAKLVRYSDNQAVEDRSDHDDLVALLERYDAVAPEDGVELGSLRPLTRSLMDQMEEDLGTLLDWVAVDHHNTGHPHTHIVVRGVTEDGKILNIAGDYIAHGIRARASEIVTLELGPQTEREVQEKLRQELDEDRFTRLDAALLKEANDEGLIDLRPGAEQSHLGRANRYLLIDRLKKLERLDLAHEVETGRLSLSSAMEQTLDRLDERQQIDNAMHRVLERQGVVRGVELYVIHRDEVTSPIVGRVLGKGLAEELGDEKYLIIDGIDGRAHYVEIADPDQLDESDAVASSRSRRP